MNTLLIIAVLIVAALLIYSYKDTYKEYFWFLSSPEEEHNDRQICVGNTCALPKKNKSTVSNETKRVREEKREKREEKIEEKIDEASTSTCSNSNTYETNTQGSGSNYSQSNSEGTDMSSQISNGSFLSKDSNLSAGSSADIDASSNYSFSSSFLND